MVKPKPHPSQSIPAQLVGDRRRALLAWYDQAARDLPWRYKDGAKPDPYRIWLSEIMLQQTTVAAVTPYFQTFTEKWPTVLNLAKADRDDLLSAWAGLGYYARARNLHKCAGVVATEHNGVFPKTVQGLQALPGIGTYTAAAIAAIAFGQAAVPVDGNVIRVLARLHGISDPMPTKKAVIEHIAATYAAQDRAGDFAQSLIELGATLCRDKNPACAICPVAEHCQARLSGEPTAFPVKAKKKTKPTRYGWVFWIEDGRGRVLVRKRPDQGLLGGMLEFPGTDWLDNPLSQDKANALAPMAGSYRQIPGQVNHTFTHFHLELECLTLVLETPANPSDGAYWAEISDLSDMALPSLMQKAARHCRTALHNRKD